MTATNLTISVQGMKFGMRRKLFSALVVLLCFCGPALGLPSAPTVVSGSAHFTTNGSTLTVTNSANAIINWNSFSINNGELTRFVQPAATSAVLNRVIGSDPSHIFGSLQSNGRVLLVNQNGVLFGPTARVDVNGLVASTLNISNEDFLAGRLKFAMGSLAGPLENQGEISTPSGGSVYLIAPDVTNSGIIKAPNGDIVLAAGNEVLLVDSSMPEVAVVLSAPEHQAVNIGQLLADAGRIGVYGGVVRQKGIISADSVVQDAGGRVFLKATTAVTLEAGSRTTATGPSGGDITIQASEGTTLVSGDVAANGHGAGGGAVQLLGQYVAIADQARIDASGATGGGTVLVGGDYRGQNPLVQNALATYLGADAAIIADGIMSGDGGKVILWSDNATRVYGAISARGGLSGGSGGFVETSGHYLEAVRAPDVSAPSGNGGTWLIDPYNLQIVSTTPYGVVSSGTNPITFTSTMDSSMMDPTTIMTALNAGSSVIVETGAGGTQPGDITVNSAITKTAGGSASLSLLAHNTITVNAGITSTSGALALSLVADKDMNGVTPIDGAVAVGAPLSTNGGDLQISSHGHITFASAGDVTTSGGLFRAYTRHASANISLPSGTIVDTDFGVTKAGRIELRGDGGGSISLSGAVLKSNLIEMAGGSVSTLSSTLEAKQQIDIYANNYSVDSTTMLSTDLSSEFYEIHFAPFTPYSNMAVSTYLGGFISPSQLTTKTLVLGNEGDTTRPTQNLTVDGAIIRPAGTRVALLADGIVSGSGQIQAEGLGVIAGGGISLSNVNVGYVALQSGGGGISLTNATGLNVVSASGGLNDPTTITGINSNGATINLTVGGDLTIVSPINAGGGAVTIDTSGGIYTGSPGAVNVVGGSFSAYAGTNVGGPSYSLLSKVLTWSALQAGGDLYLENFGAVATSGSVNAGGMVSLSAHSPLTIGAGGVYAVGDIKLLAAPMGGLDDLTINGEVRSSTGNLYLAAGNLIVENALVIADAGTITRTPYLNGGLPPSLQPAPPPPPLYSDPASSTGDATLEETTSDLLADADSSPELMLVDDDGTTEDADGQNGEDKDRQPQSQSNQQEGETRDAKPKKNYCN